MFTVLRSCWFPQDENITELCAETWRPNLVLKLLEIIHEENFPAIFLFLPGAIECLLNHPDRKFRAMHCLRSFKFQICCHFPACSYWKRRAFDLQLVSWSQESGTGSFNSESNLVMLCWSMSGSLMSLNWHSVFWLRAGLGTTYSNKDKSLC